MMCRGIPEAAHDLAHGYHEVDGMQFTAGMVMKSITGISRQALSEVEGFEMMNEEKGGRSKIDSVDRWTLS